MPTINLPMRKTQDKSNNLIYKLVYNTRLWRKIRLNYLMQNPLCEICLDNGKIIGANEVHHINPISNATSEMEIKRLGFNTENLMSLCSECHNNIHKKK